MPRPALEVADIFRDYGAAWRQANAGHVSLQQLKVMSAIESCRAAAFGRPCRALRGLRLYDHRLQVLPQPALPEVPGRCRKGMARRARGRPVAGAVMCCRHLCAVRRKIAGLFSAYFVPQRT